MNFDFGKHNLNTVYHGINIIETKNRFRFYVAAVVSLEGVCSVTDLTAHFSVLACAKLPMPIFCCLFMLCFNNSMHEPSRSENGQIMKTIEANLIQNRAFCR